MGCKGKIVTGGQSAVAQTLRREGTSVYSERDLCLGGYGQRGGPNWLGRACPNKEGSRRVADVSNPGTLIEAVAKPAAPDPSVVPVTQSKWYRLHRSCASLMSYLLDSEVHTYAFSVAAMAIISFIPFIVLLYTISRAVFHSSMMVRVMGDMVHYFLPSNQDWVAANLAQCCGAAGVQLFSLIMILISCTGIFLPLEVALNQAWGVAKSRNYLANQAGRFWPRTADGCAGAWRAFLVNAGEQVAGLVFVFSSHRQHRLQSSQLLVARGLEWHRVYLVFLLDLLAAAQPQGARSANVLRTSIVTGIIWLAAKYIFVAMLPYMDLKSSLWAVLCFGGVAVLGLCLGADSICRGAVQRVALWQREEVAATAA